MTQNGWLILDCGINARSTAEEWNKILSGPLADTAVAGIIVSHYHADHVGYAGELSRLTGAPIYMGFDEHEQALWNLAMSDDEAGDLMAETYKRFGFDLRTVEHTRSKGNYYRQLAGDLPVDIHKIGREKIFESVAGTWEIRFDCGHSPGQLSLFDQKRKLHICVDFLLPRISPNISVPLRNINIDMLGHYMNYLHDMKSLDDDWLIIPGHDWPYYGGGTRARQLIEHHTLRLDQLKSASETGPMTTFDAMNVLFNFELTDHELFFASCEARAHLNYLVETNQLKRTTKDGVDSFSKS